MGGEQYCHWYSSSSEAYVGTRCNRGIYGVTTDAARVLFLPLEPLLTNLTTPAVRPLAVLLSVFNHRPDLGPRFPTVLAGNFTALLRWGAQVAMGQCSDPVEEILLPYAAYYAAASSGAVVEG